MVKYRYTLFFLLLIAIIAYLQYRLWFEVGGVRDMMHLKTELQVQNEQNEKLREKNQALLFQVQRLQKSKDSSESRARNELGMIKKGETFYQIIK